MNDCSAGYYSISIRRWRERGRDEKNKGTNGRKKRVYGRTVARMRARTHARAYDGGAKGGREGGKEEGIDKSDG